MKHGYGLIFLICLLAATCSTPKAIYLCTPCNLDCDDLTHQRPGKCPHCKMDLIKKSKLEEVAIHSGSGFFRIPDGPGRYIPIFYHKPKNFRPDSEIILVIPGSGRSAASYRDTWIEASEIHSLLIVSPMYPERMYGFEDYHLCGLIKPSNLLDQVTYVENANFAQLDENGLILEMNPRPEDWIFGDFDRIYTLVREAVNSSQQSYILFGHSAGGHILHRFALFAPASYRAKTIVAANASFYTFPDPEINFPFGLREAPDRPDMLKEAFEKEFILFLGEQDDETETRGTFLRSTTSDQQGLHRLARGKAFFDTAREVAEASGYPFNWKLVIIPGVGHDQQGMGHAAANYLFGQTR